MKKLWVIIQREYLTRVTKKSFLITTFLVPLLIAGFYAGMIYLGVAQTGKAKRVAVVDESGLFQQKLKNSKMVQFTYPSENFENLKSTLDDTDYSGILYIPKIDIYKVNDNIKYYSPDQIGTGPKEYIVGQLEKRVKQLRMEDKGIDQGLLKSLDVNIQLPELGVSDSEQDTRAGSELLSMMGVIMAFVLYFVLMLFGTMVMRGVKEEKTNRIVEVIMSSVKPFQLMFGKIIGISFVGVTQFLIWGVLFYTAQLILMPILMTKLNIDPAAMQAINSGNTDAVQELDLDKIERLVLTLSTFNYTKLITAFIFYFLGGYFIYASLFSAVGSVVEDDNESQQLMMPVMMPIIISIGIVTSVMNDPNNPIATWASMFPLTSPIVMPARIPFNPPTWQIAVSVLMIILGVLFCVWLSAKIYRIGILMYGKKVNFKEIWKWLRYSS